MGEIATFLLPMVFYSLSALHVAWALGITWGFNHSLPTDEHGNRVINPKKRDSLVVGIGLLLFGLYYHFIRMGLSILPSQVDAIMGWLIPSIFLFRAMGDFRYVGVFKKIRQTTFGKTDTYFIIPLCLLLAILGYSVAVS
ncbi:MAG: hypothetical protein Tsb0034_07100 [Ekhidna sp.]